MDTDGLRKELLVIDSLVKDNIIPEEEGKLLKQDLIKKYRTEFVSSPKKELPNDIAHIPGRLVGGIIKACGNINGARCAGVSPEQIEADKSRPKRNPTTTDNLPEIYRY